MWGVGAGEEGTGRRGGVGEIGGEWGREVVGVGGREEEGGGEEEEGSMREIREGGGERDITPLGNGEDEEEFTIQTETSRGGGIGGVATSTTGMFHTHMVKEVRGGGGGGSEGLR